MQDDALVPAPDPETEDAIAPVPLTPETLIEACRMLQRRLPWFDQLSVREAQALLRVSSLSPEFVDFGIEAACAYDKAESVLGLSGEDMRDLSASIDRRAELQREFQKLADGIGAAILKDKHRLGRASLLLYTVLGQTLRDPNSPHRHLRPYYENMKKAYMKGRKTKKKGKGQTE